MAKLLKENRADFGLLDEVTLNYYERLLSGEKY